ncbi:MAG: transposase, partial [Elusimicrobiota bacterium]|nr:transposase [Elusimicrobiota bacterium]
DNGKFDYERDFDKIDRAAGWCGFFCLITNTDYDSAEILLKYRQKDIIEKAFDDIKNHIDMKRLRTHTSATTNGKIFCAFIALIVISEIGNKLGVFLRDKSWSKGSLIQELEKISLIMNDKGQRLMNPLTKTQRTILEAFGLNEHDLKAYVGSSK